MISVSGAGMDLADQKTYDLGAKRAYYAARFSDNSPREIWQREASPVTYVTSNAPAFLILYAAGESKALQRQSQRLSEVLKREQVPYRLVVVPGQSHERMVLTLSRPDRTSADAIVVDHEALVVAKSYREFRQFFPQAGWVEHDPAEIWESTRTVIAEAVAQVDPKQILAVGVTNQRETVVSWNPTTGQPLHNAIVWQDRRTSARCAEIKREGFEKEIRQRTGLVCDPYFSATKIEWLLQI